MSHLIECNLTMMCKEWFDGLEPNSLIDVLVHFWDKNIELISTYKKANPFECKFHELSFITKSSWVPGANYVRQFLVPISVGLILDSTGSLGKESDSKVDSDSTESGIDT